MAIEVGLKSRLARQKLKTNLTLLNNASIRTAEKVRIVSVQRKTARKEIDRRENGFKNWLATFAFGLFLTVIIIISALQAL